MTDLDRAWEAINVLGGVPANEYERGFNDAIGRALDEIEKLGGKDPLVHRQDLFDELVEICRPVK